MSHWFQHWNSYLNHHCHIPGPGHRLPCLGTPSPVPLLPILHSATRTSVKMQNWHSCFKPCSSPWNKVQIPQIRWPLSASPISSLATPLSYYTPATFSPTSGPKPRTLFYYPLTSLAGSFPQCISSFGLDIMSPPNLWGLTRLCVPSVSSHGHSCEQHYISLW